MKTSLNVSVWKEGQEYVIKERVSRFSSSPEDLLISETPYDEAVAGIELLEIAAAGGVIGKLTSYTDSGNMKKELERLKALRTLYVVRGADGVFATSLSSEGPLFLSPAATAEKAVKILNEIVALGKEFTKGENSFFAEAARAAAGR